MFARIAALQRACRLCRPGPFVALGSLILLAWCICMCSERGAAGPHQPPISAINTRAGLRYLLALSARVSIILLYVYVCRLGPVQQPGRGMVSYSCDCAYSRVLESAAAGFAMGIAALLAMLCCCSASRVSARLLATFFDLLSGACGFAREDCFRARSMYSFGGGKWPSVSSALDIQYCSDTGLWCFRFRAF